MAEAVRVRSKKKGNKTKPGSREKQVDTPAREIKQVECIIQPETVETDQPEVALEASEVVNLTSKLEHQESQTPAQDEVNSEETKPAVTSAPPEATVEPTVNTNKAIATTPLYSESVPTIPAEASVYSQLQESLTKLEIAMPIVQELATPSAPMESAEVASQHPVDVDLPKDRPLERISFPATLSDCIERILQEQEYLSTLKPFTAEQLKAFYENPLLDGEAAILESFLDCRRGLESHPLYESLSSFLRSRLALQEALDELTRLDKDVEATAANLWTVATKKVVQYGDCADGKRVKAQDDYPVAHFDQKGAAQVVRQLKQEREIVQERLALSVYESHWWKLRIDSLLCQDSSSSIHGNVSVLFAFLRRPVRDRHFVDQLKCWLNYAVNALLAGRARVEDYLFLAHHVLRCPAGLARWGRPYLQAPFYDRSGDNEDANAAHVDVVLALLSALCQPVQSRAEFLQSCQLDEEATRWVWLDSEGDDDEESSDPVNMTDDDLLALLNQIPLGNVFRSAFRLVQRDGKDVLPSCPLQAGQWLRALAISRHLLSMLDAGLRTYGGPRYKNLAKKLGQLVLHTVCTVADAWLDHWARSTDGSMLDRLLREYEEVVLQGLGILIRTRLQRSWQLLSRLPLAGITPRIRLDLWLLWHSEICEEPVQLESIRAGGGNEPFWNLLSAKLVQLPEPDWFVFSATLAAMAGHPSARTGDPFLQLVTWELTELGLVNETTTEACFRTAKELLAGLVARHPPVVSFVLERLKLTGQAACSLAFFKDLPLVGWRPTGEDFECLRDWLLDGPLDSTRHQLAVTILTRLNWALEKADQGGTRPFLGASFHQQMALLLVEAVSIHSIRVPVPSAVPVPAMATNFLADSVQFLSSFSRSWNSASLVQWAWHVVLKLRLHAFDSYPDHLRWMLHNPQRAFRFVRQFHEDAQFQTLRRTCAQQPSPSPFSAFVALSATSVGHSLPELCGWNGTTSGLDLLSALSAAGHHQPVIVLLHHLFPLLASCPDVVYGQPGSSNKLLEVIQRLVQADCSYYKRAKNLLAPQFPGTVLRLTASLMDNTVCKLDGLNLTGLAPPLEVWLALLTRLPRWNADKSVLYLLDALARTAWPDPSNSARFRQILAKALEDDSGLGQVQRPAKGLASRVLGSWAGGSSSSTVDGGAAGQTDYTELIPPVPAFPYLSWMVLDLEAGRQASLWRNLVVDLQPGRASKSLDGSLKAAAGSARIPTISPTQLCIVRYAQLAADMSSDPDHPLLPLILQRFFCLYFARPVAEGANAGWAVGQRIMTSSAGLSALLKRLALSWVDAAKRLEDQNSRNYANLSSFYRTSFLWLEDVKLLEPGVYLPSLAPNYHPARLLQLFQGSEPWLDLCRMETVQLERFELRQLLDKERNLPSGSSQAGRQSQQAAGSQPPGESLVSRLQSYSDPIRLTRVDLQPAFFRLPFSALRDVGQLRPLLARHLAVVASSAERFVHRTAELTALDCQYAELLAEQFTSSRLDRQVAVKCAGTQSGEPCSGAAVVRLSCEPWRPNATARSRAESNRQEAARLRTALHEDPSVRELCGAALLLDDCVRLVCGVPPSTDEEEAAVLEAGAALFYTLVELVDEDTNLYPPTKQLLSSCLESLGQKCIAGHPEQCRNLVGLLGSNPNLAGLVAPHFTPSTAGPASSAAIEAFVDSYRLVTALSKQENDLILVLLTKFDVRWWLNCAQCWPSDRAKLLDAIASALDGYGLQPGAKALAAHEVLRRHWQLLLAHNFPEQYGRTLRLLLRSSETQSVSPILWCDLINSLGQGYLRFRPLPEDAPTEEFRQQVLHYTTQQSLMNAGHLMETAQVLSEHFAKERQLHGLYGLYPKYRPYVHALSGFLLMVGHALTFATLKTDAGTPSDLLVGQLWSTLRDLYSPWLLPYTPQEVNNQCAAWIQRLQASPPGGADKLLLPWIAADSLPAGWMASSAVHCAGFLHEAVPAQHGVLSHLLAFYVHGYCHPAVKPHILQVIHPALESLPWHTFVPSPADLELLVRATAQFLPEVHAFLVGLFVRFPISALVAQWAKQPGQPYGLARLLSCLLHLYVRLAGEPNARENPAMKRILEEASATYPWQHIDANVYDQVLNWYVSTCDPLFVLQPHVEGTESAARNSPSNDALVFRLLQSASVSAAGMDSSAAAKRRMLIRSWIRLIALNVSRHRAVVQKSPFAVQRAVEALLDFIVSSGRNGSDSPAHQSLHEYLTAMAGSSPIADALQAGLCQRIESGGGGDQALLEAILRLMSTLHHGDLKRVAIVMESALEHLDAPKSTLTSLLPANGTKELSAACWKQSCILAWFCLVEGTEVAPEDDVSYALDHLLAGCKSLSLSEAMEPKLCLVYARLASFLNRLGGERLGSALRSEWSELLSSWAEENKSWLSSIGLGKAPRLSCKGRLLARIMACLVHPTPDALDQLARLGAHRHYAECCKPALDLALEGLRNSSSLGDDLLRQLVPLLYSRPYLTRLLIQ